MGLNVDLNNKNYESIESCGRSTLLDKQQEQFES